MTVLATHPQNPTELEDWLQVHCKAGELSTNLTSFSGKRFADTAKTLKLTDGSWYLFDDHREAYAEHSVRIINDHQKPLPCLNMLIPAGTDWNCKPFMDVDFDNRETYERFLRYTGISSDHHFYLAVQQAFGEMLFGGDVSEKIHDDYIAFSRQPDTKHKFHLVYIGEEPIVWSKTEKEVNIAKVARYLAGKFRLNDLDNQGPMVAAIPPCERHPRGKPARYWVTNHDGNAPAGAQCAAFVDIGAKGLRPLGCSKQKGRYDRDQVYHVYRLNCTPSVKVPLTTALFLSHLIVLPGQESKRQKRKDVELKSLGHEEEAGASSVNDAHENNERHFHHSGSHHIQSWISGLQSSKGSLRDEDIKSTRSNMSKLSGISDLSTRSNPRDIREYVLAESQKRKEARSKFKIQSKSKRRYSHMEDDDIQSMTANEIDNMIHSLKKKPRMDEGASETFSVKDNENFFVAKGKNIGRHLHHQAATGSNRSMNGEPAGKKSREPTDPCRPSSRRVWQGKASQYLDDYVLGNKYLPWSKDLKKANWTIGRLVRKACPPNLSTIMISLDYLGISDQVFTFELAIKMCAALTNQSAEFFAEILHYLVGTHSGKQGRIEVDGRSGSGLQWWMFNLKEHGWEVQEGTNTHILGALRGVFVAFREYLVRSASKIDHVAPDANATSWFSSANEQRHHPVLLCYDEVMRMIMGQNGTRTCHLATQEAWERIIRNNCRIEGRSISQILNEDKYKVAFQNGVFDLKKYRLRNGRPEDFTSYTFGFKYQDWRTEIIQGYTEDGTEIIKPEYQQQVKEWRRFFAQIFPIEEVRYWIYLVLTSCLGGMPPDLLYILTGAGSNGKSVFIKLLETVFGGYYTTISSSKLTERKGHSSGADPQTLQLKGKRVRADTEPEEGVPLNAAYIKARFDTQTARGLYEGSPRNQQHFYKHFLACNTIPPSSGDECNTRRQCVIPMLTRFSFNPNKDDKLDMQADEFVGNKSREWRHTLVPYLISLWQMHDAGNTTKSDPLNVFKLPPAVKSMNDRFKREGDFGLGFISRLVKSQYGFKSFDDIWNEYRAEHDVEFKTPEDRRQNQKLSKVQMYRHLAREFGQPQAIPHGAHAGEYYRCYNPRLDSEPTKWDEKLPLVHGSLGEQFAKDLDKVRAGNYSAPANRGYEKKKNTVHRNSQQASDSSSSESEAETGDESSDTDSGSSSDLESLPEATQKRSKKPKQDNEDDAEFKFSMPNTTSRNHPGIQRRSSSSSEVESQALGGGNADDDGASTIISEISLKEGNLNLLAEKRKRKVTDRLADRLIDNAMDDDEGTVEHSDDDEERAPRPRQRQRIHSDTEEEIDETENGNAGALPLHEEGQDPMAAGPVKARKRSRIHRGRNKFIEEGANVSDDDGEGDEDENDIPNEEDEGFIATDDEIEDQ